jgi:OmpA-OmpF porin, OOP family
MKFNWILPAALGCTMVLFGTAHANANANDLGGYFGVAGGQARHHDLDREELDDLIFLFEEFGFSVVSGTSSLSSSDTAWSLFGGYNFTQHLGVEVGYHHLGTAKYRATASLAIFGEIEAVSVGADITARGFTAAGVGRLPIGDVFELRAMVGVFVADADVTVRIRIDDISEQDSFSENSTDVFFGAGAAFHFARNWTLGADYRLFRNVGDEFDISTLTVGLSYRF